MASAEASATVSEDAARAEAEAFLDAEGIPFRREPLLAAEGGFGTSLYAEVAPARGEAGAPAFVVAVPLAAGDGNGGAGFAVRSALAFARRASREGTPAAVTLAFLAGEASALPAAHRRHERPGLRALSALFADEGSTAVVYLEPRGAGRPVVSHGSAGTVAPLGLLAPVLSGFAAAGVPARVELPYNELYRLRLVAGRGALSALHGAGFPAVAVADEGEGPGASEDDYARALLEASRVLGDLSVDQDRRYTLVPLGSSVLRLDEGLSIRLFLAATAVALALFLTYSITHRRFLVARGRVFLKRSWTVLPFLASLFAGFWLAGRIVEFLIAAAGTEADPYGAAGVQVLLAVALYVASTPLLELAHVPKRARFYGSAATLLLAAGGLVATALDVTFVPVFLWAFACAFAASSVHVPALVLALAFLAPLQAAGAAAAAIGSGDATLARLVLSGSPGVTAYLAFALLPFLLLFRRAAVLARGAGERHLGVREALARLLLLAGAAAAAASFAFAAPPRAPAAEAVDPPGPLVLNVRSRTFLDRRTFRISADPAGKPARIDLRLESAAPIAVYDAPAPFDLADDGLSLEFRLAEDPPDPLVLELTLPIDFAGILRAEAVYAPAQEFSAPPVARAEARIGGPP